MSAIGVNLLRLIGVVIIGLLMVLFRGVVLSDFVDWFSPFSISNVQGAGIALGFGLLTLGFAREKQSESWLGGVALGVCITLIVWGMGAIFSFFA